MPRLDPAFCHTQLLSILAVNLTHTSVRDAFTAFHFQHRDRFLDMPASTRHHHAFPGGYTVHIFEVTRNLLQLMEKFPSDAFTRQDAVIAAYVHDLDKLFWRYERDLDPPSEAQVKYAVSLGIKTEGETKKTLSQLIDAKKNGQLPPELSRHTRRKDCPFMDDSAAVATLMLEHGLPGWNVNVASAVSLHHGGWAPVAKNDSGHNPFPPLAVLLHTADLISAQMQNGEVSA